MTAPAPAAPDALSLLEEIESGIKTYEDEHKSHAARDDCNGIYIPINVVRRLVAVRKKKILQSQQVVRR